MAVMVDIYLYDDLRCVLGTSTVQLARPHQHVRRLGNRSLGIDHTSYIKNSCP